MDTPATTEYYGPYDNFGYLTADEEVNGIGWREYAYGGFSASCSADNGNGANRDCGLILRDNDSAVEVHNPWSNVPNEKLTDYGSYGDSGMFIDKWYAYHIDVQDSPAELAFYSGTAATNNWNLFFLDNYQIYNLVLGGWSDDAIDPRRGGTYTRANRETDALAGMAHMRTLADADGMKLFCNMDGDTDYEYFNRGTTYPTWINKCDYGLLEQWANDFNENPVSEADWLRRVNIAKDMIQNLSVEPIVNGWFGDMWYNLATLLLVRENGKGMIYWQSDIPGTGDLTKMNNLDCGQPLEDFQLISNSYYRRDWEECIILVNPKTGSTGSISLGGSYTDIETGGSVSSIVLPAKSGAVLIKQ